MPEEKETAAPEKKETAAPKLIGGKYKTVEEAEAALLEKDRTISRLGSEKSQLQHDLQSASQPAREGTRTADPTGDDERIAHEFLTKPQKFLDEYGRAIQDQTLKQARLETSVYVETRLVFEKFIDKHPLVTKDKNKTLFKAFMAEAQGETLEERLNDAYATLEKTLAGERSEGKKNAEAERAARKRAEQTSRDEDENDAGARGTSDEEDADDEEDTPESYLKDRERAFSKIKGSLV